MSRTAKTTRHASWLRSLPYLLVLTLVLTASGLPFASPVAAAHGDAAGPVPAEAPAPEPQPGDAPGAVEESLPGARTELALDPDALVPPFPEPIPDAVPPGAELTELRTENSSTYAQDDGSFVTELHSRPVFYRPEPGAAFAPIEVGFGAAAADGSRRSDRAATKVEVRSLADAAGFLAVDHDDVRLRFSLPTATPISDVLPEPDRAGRFVDYADAFEGGADLRVFPGADGVKTFIILPDASQHRFDFLVDAPGLTLESRDDGSIGLSDPDGGLVGTIPRPFLVDSSTDVSGLGSGRYSEAVALELGARGDRWLLSIVIDEAFLADAVYPVYVDPTTTFKSSDAGDTFVSETYPTTNYNQYARPDSPYYHEMWLGEDPASGKDNRVFMKFYNFDDVLEDAHVTDAELRFMPYHQYTAAKNSWLKRVTENWTPGTLIWNDKPSTAALASGDEKKVKTSAGTTAIFEVGKTVQKWIDGTWNNYGFRLDENGNDEAYWKRLISEQEGGSDIPRLRITWHRPLATPLSPTGGATTASRALAWSYDDDWAGGDPAQSHFRALVASDSDCSTVLTDGDSGEVASADTSWTFPANVSLTDQTTYHWCVRVKDGSGWSDWTSDSFTWDSDALTADIGAPVADGAVGTSATISGTAAGTGFTSYTLKYQSGCTPGGTLLDIGTNPRTTAVSDGTLGTWDTSSLSEADYLVELSVAASPSALTDTICVSVDHTDPSASLETAPLSAVADISGTANDADFASYTLEYAAGADATSGFVAVPDHVPASTAPVTTLGTLASWDTTDLQGSYTLRLTVSDRAGNSTSVDQNLFIENDLRGLDSPAERVPIELAGGWSASIAPATGEATVSRELFSIPSYGPAQRLALSYSSFETADTGFGTGWSSDLTQSLDLEDGLVVWQMADGTLVPFTGLTAGWTGLPSRFETLTHQSGAGTYTITLPDGSAYVFDDSGAGHLLSIEDRYGQSLDLVWNASSATATDESGRATTLTIDGNDRITAAEDSAGREWAFAYTGGALTTVTDPEDVETDLDYGADGIDEVSMTRTQDGVSQDIIWEIGYELSTPRVNQIALSSGGAYLAEVDYGVEQYTLTVTLSDTSSAETRYNVQSDLLVSTITDAQGGTRTLEWTDDGTRQLESVTDSVAEGIETVISFTYDTDSGYVETETAPVNGSTDVTTAYTYDGNDDLTEVERSHGVNPPIGLDGTIAYSFTVDRERTSMTEGAEPGGLDLETTYTYTSEHQLETETAPDDTVTKYEYDSHGNRTAMVQNHVSGQSATSSRNVRTEYAYDGTTTAGKAGLMTSMTDPLGRVTAYEYDDLGRLTTTIRNEDSGSSASDANLTTETLYDAIGWVEATIDERGTVTRFVTDRFGRTTTRIEHCTDTGSTPSSAPRTCDGDGTHDWQTNIVTAYVYDDAGNLTSETIGEGASSVTTAYEYDDLSRQTTMTLDPSGLALSTEFAYDDAGNEIAVADPRGTVTRSVYDEAGNLTKTIETCSSSAKVLPDPIESCTGEGTANAVWNRVTEYDYDEYGRLETETAPNGRITTYEYDSASRLTTRIDNDVTGTPSGNEDLETTYAYDDMGRQTAVRTPTWSRTSFIVTGTVYDELGRVTTSIERCTDSGTTVPAANVGCTGAGTQDVVTNQETAFSYDAAGNQVSVTTPSPAAPASGSGWLDTVTTRYAYDGADRLCRVLENAGTDLQSLADPCATAVTGTTSSDLSTTYGYDEAGNLTAMTDAGGEEQTYTYDRLGRLTSRTDGLDATITWAYDVRGNRLTQSDRERAPAISVTWTYDTADRMTSRTADSATVDYTYDDIGGLISADGPTGEISITRNRLGDPTTVEPDDGSAETDYTYSFTSPERSDASGDYEFELDEWGREVEITAPLHTSPFTFTIRPDGDRKQRSDPNGMDHDYGYTGGRLGDIVSDGSGCSGASCADIEYTYNRAGMRLSEDSSIDTDPANGTASFEYDAVGRLIDNDAPGAYADEEYGWSEVLDRETLKNGGTTITTTFDAAHRPTSDDAGGSYDHDDDGRLTAQPGQVLEWDSLGRLTTVKDGSDDVLSSYTYDALDRLREVTSSGTTIRHRYVGTTTQVSQLRNVTTSSNIRKFVHSWSGELLARFTTPTTGRRYYGINGHGDLAWTATGSAAVSKTVRYDPWGNAIAAPSGQPDFGFQGSWLDPATDLYWVIARWYAPGLGTFISEDELLGEPVNPASRHLYAYGWGDPVGKWDPDGRIPAVLVCLHPLGALACAAAVAVVRFGPGAVNALASVVRRTPRAVGTIGTVRMLNQASVQVRRSARSRAEARLTMRQIASLNSRRGKHCWAIGEIQHRVTRFARWRGCDYMYDLSRVRSFRTPQYRQANLLWAMSQMFLGRKLYDLGTCRRPPRRASGYYAMERALTMFYPRSTKHWGWGRRQYGCSW